MVIYEEPAERVACVGCGAGAPTVRYARDGKDWWHAPPGWLVSDTFPPGDDGVQWLCPRCGVDAAVRLEVDNG